MSRTFRSLILLLAVLLVLGGHAFASPIGLITITGAEQSSAGAWDTGTVTATINGVSVSVPYNQYSTPAGIASALGATISQNCNMTVYAHAVGAVLKFYPKTARTITSATISTVSSNPAIFPNVSFTIGGVSSWSPPDITSLSLTEGPPSMGFVIYGTNFGSTQGTVTIGGISATIISWTATAIVMQVPDGLTAGTYSVEIATSSWSVFNTGTTTFQVDDPFECD
jgi:hypothetical protein